MASGIYDGITITDTGEVRIQFASVFEAKAGVESIRVALDRRVACECCGGKVFKLECHHWWEPPKYAYSERYICQTCNQKLTPAIWELHPGYDGVRIPSHILPAWGVQRLYAEDHEAAKLPGLLGGYQLPLPIPRSAEGIRFLWIKRYQDYWNKYGYAIYTGNWRAKE